jgi:hypothetical protein
MLGMAAIAISTSAVASAQFKFTKIDVPKSVAVNALGISNKNEVVGNYVIFQSTETNGFWRTNDVPAIMHYPLEDPRGSASTLRPIPLTRAESWWARTRPRLKAKSHIISYVGMFLNGGAYFDFSVNGCTNTVVNGIDDRGETTGTCQLPDNDVRGWFSTRPSGLVTFDYPGADQTYASAINNERSVVGTYIVGSSTHGYLRDAQGDFTSIDFPSAYATYANGISDTGVISGPFQDGSLNYHGFVYSAGTFVQVDVPGASRIVVNQINKHGRFVGSYDDPANGHTFGFIAKPIPGANVLVESDDPLN